MGNALDEDDEKTDPGPCSCSECRVRLRLRERIVEARVMRFTSVQQPLEGGWWWTVYLQREGATEVRGAGSTEENAIDQALRLLGAPP